MKKALYRRLLVWVAPIVLGYIMKRITGPKQKALPAKTL
ncbi:hypothetical protein SAMN05443292_2684 [Halpernia frigidisoli]|uniref:Uncharacterized protein n=1 Tax=Halpernia frigidisoli TaxID=1125876 RepID=A0A1I3ILN0_9FLAO|nr:hypothetical protein SAMN05443292_2684 [Halpernia frigidisoli]